MWEESDEQKSATKCGAFCGHGHHTCGKKEFAMSKSEEARLLRRTEVEEQFGISVRFLELAVARGDGPPIVRLGRAVRYRICDVRAWIDQRVEM